MSFPKNAFLLFSGNGGEVSSGQTQASAWGALVPTDAREGPPSPRGGHTGRRPASRLLQSQE